MLSHSVPVRPNGSCPSASYHKRKSYTSKRGHRVHARCIRSTTPYKQSSAAPRAKRSVTQRQTRRLKSVLGETKVCPPGKILRAPYVRRFRSSVKAKGYNRKTKSGKIVHVVPTKASAILVPAVCIKDLGKKGKGTQKIGPLREGLLKKYGYRAALTRYERHAALGRAVKALGSNNVFHKLDAVAKLSLRTHPDSSKIFAEDRDWVRKEFGIKAF